MKTMQYLITAIKTGALLTTAKLFNISTYKGAVYDFGYVKLDPIFHPHAVPVMTRY